MTHPRLRLALTAVILAAGLSALRASPPSMVVVSPPHFADEPAWGLDDAPLGSTGEVRFQQILAPSLLTAIEAGSSIVGIGFRVAAYTPAVAAQTVPNYSIWMGQSANSPLNMSTTFAQNRGVDYLQVRTGALEITEDMFPGDSDLNAFGFISFSTPYIYTGGSLLIEVAYNGFTSGQYADSRVPTEPNLEEYSPIARTAFGASSGSVIADQLYGEAIVMGFQVVPVPEPSFAMPLLGGFLLLAFYARNRR